jgi:hypothetical protein
MSSRQILVLGVIAGAAALAMRACGALLLLNLRAEHLNFVEIGIFGRMGTVRPFLPFLMTHRLPDEDLVFGVSPAGDRLLILADSHRNPEGPQTPKKYDEIEVTTLDRRVENRIFPAVYTISPFAAELSPDGQMIAFIGQFATRDLSRADYGLHLLKLSGEASTLVATTEAKTPESIGWAKDGRTLVYDLDGRILLYHLDTSTSSPLTEGSRPVWSPDGAWIAYRRPDGGAALIHPDGSGGKAILGNTQLGWGLRWSPDGRYLLYAGVGIRVLEVATGRTATIFTPFYSPFEPSFTETSLRWVRGMPQ